MKKNKLTFLIVASFLALSAVAGCDSNTPVEHSSKNDETSAQTSDSGQTQSSDQGNSNTSDSSGGGNQTGKTDWTDAEKTTMRGVLHGLVLPFVEMDVSVSVSQSSGSVKIESQENMASGFLASYKAKFDADPEWVGEDISSEYGVYPGNAFAYQRPVTENGKKYYVAVMFTGIQMNPGDREPTITKDGRFYLEAMDPYVYEYPGQFIGQWLSQMYGTVIVPPAFQAEFYSLDEEGVLLGYSETNIEAAYKATLEGSSSFTVDANKNADGYYVAHPSDGSYVLLFKYDSDNKVMILKVEENKGWNAALINKFFTKYNQTPLNVPALEIDGASYKFVEYDTNERYAAQQQYYAVGATYTISKTGLTSAPLAEYARKLREAGFAVNGIANDDGTIDDYYAIKAIKDGDLYTLSISYVKTPIGGSKPQIVMYFTADGQEVPNLLAAWPATQLAAFFGNEITDALPAFSGVNCGFMFGVNGDVASIAINVDAQVSATIKADYIALLTANNAFTEDNGKYISKNNQYTVRVGDPAGNGLYDVFQIRIEKIHAPVATPWPAENIAKAIGEITTYNPTTETLPELDVSSATSCYVGYKDSTHFELIIAGLASSANDFETVFKNNGWAYDQYFDFINTGVASTTMTGGFVSPGRKLVVHFLIDGNDLVIYVKSYFEPWFTVAGLGGDWNYNHSLVFFEDATVASEVADHWYASQEKAEFSVNANDEFKVTNGVDWYGYEILESNTHFAEGNDHNIKALEKGSVVLYLKTFENGTKGIAINFTPDSSGSGGEGGEGGEQPQLTPWPETELAEFFGDDVDSIPEIKIDGASFELFDTEEQDGMKAATIIVTVDDAANEMADAIAELERQFNYSYDDTLQCYASTNEGLPYFAFTTTDGVDNMFAVMIMSMDIDLSQFTWSNALAAINQHYDGTNYQIPDLEVAGASMYFFDPDQEMLFIAFPEGENLDAKVFALNYAISQLVINEKAYHYSKLFDEYVNVRQGLAFSVIKEDEHSVAVRFVEEDLSETGYGIVVVDGDDQTPYPGELTDEFDGYTQYKVENVEFTVGMKFYVYDFNEDTAFSLNIENAYDEYLEYDENEGAYVVKKDFIGTFYVKLKYGADKLYISFQLPPED